MTALATALRAARPVALPGVLMVAAAALGVWLASPYVTLSPDARYSLAWGAELARGGSPELDVGDAPTGHPLPVAVGALLAPLGAVDAADAYSAVAVLAFGLLLYAAFRFGRALGGAPAGVLAALLVGTRPRLDFFAAHAFIDVPFAALVLLAAALVAERPRDRPARVLGLLAAAGLLRPEAWLLSAAYLAWLILARGRRPPAGSWPPPTPVRARPRLVLACALALAAPAIWVLFDLAFAGDPLQSLHGTQDKAVKLDRVTGVENLLPSLRDGIEDLVGWPLVAAGGLVALWSVAPGLGRWTRPRSVRWPPFAVAMLLALGGLAGFAALAVADLPLNDRYLLVPSLALAGLAASALRHEALRSPLLIAALVLAVGGALATASDDAGETADMLDLAREKRAADADLERLLDRPEVRRELERCQGYSVSGSGRAAAAALLERDPSEVPISRAPIPQDGRAAVSTARSVPLGTPGTTRVGAWEFVDRC